MSFHHKYLAKKSWHVLNKSNQAAVDEAEAIQATLSRRVDERKKKLERERSLQVHQRLLKDGSSKVEIENMGGLSGKATSVAFLYEPPPGFVPALAPPPLPPTPPPPSSAASSLVKAEPSQVHDLTTDAAVAHTYTNDGGGAPVTFDSSSPAALASLPLNAPAPGAGAPIESWEDRRARHRTMTPQQIREELHPALKGAPVKGDHVRAGTFTAKPLGVLLRDTRCVRCGGIGHASSDRECPRFNERGVADEATRQREDPINKIRASGGAVAGGKEGQFKLMYSDESYTVGGLDRDHPLHQVVIDDDDAGVELSHISKRHKSAIGSSSSSSSLNGMTSSLASSSTNALNPEEQAFLAGLSETDMKLLLKQLKKTSSSSASTTKKEVNSGGEEEDRHRRRKRKEKKKKDRKTSKRRRSSRSTSPSEEERKKKTKKTSRKRKHRDSSPSSSSSSSSNTSSSSDSDSSSSDRRRRHRREERSRTSHTAPPPPAPHTSSSSSHTMNTTMPTSSLPSSSSDINPPPVASSATTAVTAVAPPTHAVDQHEFDELPPLEY